MAEEEKKVDKKNDE